MIGELNVHASVGKGGKLGRVGGGGGAEDDYGPIQTRNFSQPTLIPI